MDIAKTLAALKNAGALTQDALSLVDAVKNAELYRKLSKLNLEMAGIENALAETQREATRLESENAKFKKDNADLLIAYDYANKDKNGDLKTKVEKLEKENEELKAKAERLEARVGPDISITWQAEQNSKKLQQGMQ